MPLRNIPFFKMHGLGNDFVIIDARKREPQLTKELVLAIADRHRGIGFDQMVVITKSANPEAAAHMKIYNADSSIVEACGNATRCVGRMLLVETGKEEVIITSDVAVLKAKKAKNDMVTVDMGEPILEWAKIPLSQNIDNLNLPIDIPYKLTLPGSVSMGNPHLVCPVTNIDKINLSKTGKELELHPLFPRKTNVEFVQIIDKGKIRMRVWERGCGVTQACGTGACASLVVCAQKGLTNRKCEIILDGGSLFIEWDKNNHILMTGTATLAFHGIMKEIHA